MIQTLIKLGSQLSHNRGEWDNIIDYPNIQIILSLHSIFPYNPFEAGNGSPIVLYSVSIHLLSDAENKIGITKIRIK